MVINLMQLITLVVPRFVQGGNGEDKFYSKCISFNSYVVDACTVVDVEFCYLN